MNIADYHEEVKRTSSAEFPYEETLKLSGLGIAGEAGEVVWLLDDTLSAEEDDCPYPSESLIGWHSALTKEAGDVLWYVVYLLNALDLRLEDVLEFHDLDTYQAVVRAEFSTTTPFSLNRAARRLAAHAGAVADIIKKHTLHGRDLEQHDLKYRLFQTIFYLTAILNHFDIELAVVLDINTAKLRKRYPNGWSAEASLARQDEHEDETAEAETEAETV